MSTARKTPGTRSGAAPAKVATKPAAKASKSDPAAPAPAATTKPPKAAKQEAKAPKLRPRLVRDGFTMPESDFSLIGTLKARALAAAHPAKKSELLRAGLQALSAMDTPTLVAALSRLEPVKTGRPKKTS